METDKTEAKKITITLKAEVDVIKPGELRVLTRVLSEQELGFTSHSAELGHQAPCMILKFRRVVVPIEVAPHFAIHDIRIDNVTQLSSGGAIPAEMFAPDVSFGDVKLDHGKEGTTLLVKVKNTSSEPRPFSIDLIGEPDLDVVERRVFLKARLQGMDYEDYEVTETDKTSNARAMRLTLPLTPHKLLFCENCHDMAVSSPIETRGMVPPKGRLLFKGQPQDVFSTRQMIVTTPAPDALFITEAKVGNMSQFAAPGRMSVQPFQTEEEERLDLKWDTAQVSQLISIYVQNQSDAEVPCEILLIGYVARF